MEILRLDAASFSYPTASRCVFEDVSFTLDAGQFALLDGPNGAGKTTLLRCIKPEIAPAGRRGGRVVVFGEGDPTPEASTKIGFVFQDPWSQAVCQNVWQELAFGLENTGVEPLEMRRRIAEIGMYLGLEDIFDKPLAELSSGQLQLVNVASVAVMQPRLLLLDEPLSQLDPLARTMLFDALLRLNAEAGMTLLLSTHEAEMMAGRVDRIFELREGHLRERTGDEVAAKPLMAVLKRPRGRRAGPEVKAIEARDLYFAYEKQAPWILRGLSLEVGEGKIVALVGCNGCGKTTLLDTLAGILAPTKGKVVNREAASQAYGPQDPKALFVTDSVEEELREWQSGGGYDDGALDPMLRDLGLEEKRAAHPHDLSAGQQQLLALAKLLLLRPRLLLLDEPAKGLDASAQLTLAQALLKATDEGTTIVLSTHDLALASCLADEIALMFAGEIMAVVSPERFLESALFSRPKETRFVSLWEKAQGLGDGENGI